MPEFTATGSGALRLQLEPDEAEVLRRLVAEMKGLLAAGMRREDPVIERLFPAAYEDPSEQEAFEALVGDDLHAHKLQALDEVRAKLGSAGAAEIELEGDEVGGWLAFLTDLRLAIGTRLGVTQERMGAELDPSDPETPAMSVLHWLGWLQEGIIGAVGDGV